MSGWGGKGKFSLRLKIWLWRADDLSLTVITEVGSGEEMRFSLLKVIIRGVGKSRGKLLYTPSLFNGDAWCKQECSLSQEPGSQGLRSREPGNVKFMSQGVESSGEGGLGVGG